MNATTTTWAARMPLLATVCGAAGIGVLALWRLWQALPAERAWMLAAVCVYVGWMLWESRISVAELERPDSDHDRGTMELAAAAKLLTLIACLLPASQPQLPTAAAGLLLMLGGALFRTRAIRALGAGYSHRIRLPLVLLCRAGPYGVVRHPAYLGTWGVHLGLALVFLNLWSLASALLLWGAAVVLRARLEDALLMQLPEYRDYAARVRHRLLPGVW